MVAAFSQAPTSTTTTTTNPINNNNNNNNNKTSSHQQEQNSHNQNPKRLPLEKDQNGLNPRRPRGRQVSSRYLSPSPSTSTSNTSSSSTTTTSTTTATSSSSSSKRFPSPLISRTTNSTSSLTKRSQSVDSRRSLTAPRLPTSISDSKQGNATPQLSAATKMLITSTRSLSVSFQGEAFSLPISKTKPATTTTTTTPTTPTLPRKSTPEQRRRPTPVRDQVENSKPLDQQHHRWPGRTRQGNNTNHSLTRSLDCSNDRNKWVGFGSGVGFKALQQSVIDERRLSFDLGNAELLKDNNNNNTDPDGNLLLNHTCCDLTSSAASDTDSVSSGSTSGVQECRPKTGSRPIVVSARFWQETNTRLRRLHDPGSPLSTSPGSRIATPSKFSQSKRFSSDGPMASPIRGGATTRPASPSKHWTSTSASSPLRGVSPSRVRNVVGGALSGNSSHTSNTPSILSFSVDVRRGKMGEDRIVDAHMLRLLYNRYLQWRFVNARADATDMVQRLNAEKNLWNAWVTISELRHSVTLKRVKLLLLRQKLKLTSILKGQITYLEEWSLLDRDHSNSLLGATEALKASTLRLPIIGKAVADIQNLKDAVGSAVDVMHAMASSICSLSSKVEEMNTLVAEIVNVTAKEKVLLEQCKDFLSTLAAMQVKDCSLRTHIIQLNRVPTTSSLTTHV